MKFLDLTLSPKRVIKSQFALANFKEQKPQVPNLSLARLYLEITTTWARWQIPHLRHGDSPLDALCCDSYIMHLSGDGDCRCGRTRCDGSDSDSRVWAQGYLVWLCSPRCMQVYLLLHALCYLQRWSCLGSVRKRPLICLSMSCICAVIQFHLDILIQVSHVMCTIYGDTIAGDLKQTLTWLFLTVTSHLCANHLILLEHLET